MSEMIKFYNLICVVFVCQLSCLKNNYFPNNLLPTYSHAPQDNEGSYSYKLTKMATYTKHTTLCYIPVLGLVTLFIHSSGIY